MNRIKAFISNSRPTTGFTEDNFHPPSDIGEWPLRLLHVPSMKSYEWRPGNMYGKTMEPQYAALSYTWGRYEVRSRNEQLTTKSIKIKGIDWQTPRIDRHVFTVADFKRQLKRVLQVSGEWKQPVQWLWLDIACIDQTPNSPKKAFEVGRQAAIFEGARYTVMWLHRSSLDDLAACIQDWRTANRSENEARTTKLLQGLKRLFQDPWFSSLWTVQEYHISRLHYFMTREGFPRQDSENLSFEQNLHFMSNDIDSIVERCVEITAKNRLPASFMSADEQELIDIAGSCGLFGDTSMPLSVYLAAHRRNVSHDEDRIYGIMQIFRFRLGISHPKFDSKIMKKPTLKDLEIEFGTQLLKDCPYMSQAHVQSKSVPKGQAWRVSSTSIIADRLVYKPWRLWRQYWTTLCDFSTAEYEGEIWGRFSGYACSFSCMGEKWQQCSGLNGKEGKDRKRDLIYQVLFDHSSIFPGMIVKGDFDSTNDEIQRMIEIDQKQQLGIQVLILGYMRRENHGSGVICDETMGVLLRPYCKGVWQRIGICFWGFWGIDQSTDPQMVRKIHIFTEDRLAAQSPSLQGKVHDGSSGFLEGLFG